RATRSHAAPPSRARSFDDRRQDSIQRIGIRASHKLGVAKVIHPLDAEGRATLDEHERRFAWEPPHLVGEEEPSTLLRPGAPGAELALRMRHAAHTTGLVCALHVDRR